jgi:hypothetical protein
MFSRTFGLILIQCGRNIYGAIPLSPGILVQPQFVMIKSKLIIT